MQLKLLDVLKELNKLDSRIEKSLIVNTTPASLPHNPAPRNHERTPSQEKETAQLIVELPPHRNHKQRWCERRAAKNRKRKANRTPEEKVAAAEELLNNIANQAATLTRQKVGSSQCPAKLAYKNVRRKTAENEAHEEEAALAAAFQGCGYTAKLTSQQIERATIARTIPTAVVDSGASTICTKPEEEEIQESECGGYKWK